MEIRSESHIHHPLDRVYQTYRDRLPELAPLIPDIREIRVLRRHEREGGLDLVNLWIPSREPPRAVQGVLKPELIRWEDHASWDDAAHHVDWRLVIPAWPDRVRCAGRNAFFAEGPARTRVVLTGELRIDATNFPGVPAFLTRSIGPAIERFIVELITPNLVRVNQSLEQFLDRES